MLRRDGAISPLEDCPPLNEQNLLAACRGGYARRTGASQAVPRDRRPRHRLHADGLPRFRVNVFRQRGAISFAFRVIPTRRPELRAAAACRPASSGSPTSTAASSSSPARPARGRRRRLAAMIDHINRTRQQHIVTIEDPIEILHPDRDCIVNQREVGLDTGRSGRRSAARSARIPT